MLLLCSRAAHIKEPSDGIMCLTRYMLSEACLTPTAPETSCYPAKQPPEQPAGIMQATQTPVRVCMHQQIWPRACGCADLLKGSCIVLQALCETGHPRGVLRRIEGAPIRLRALSLAPADVLTQQLGRGLRALSQLLAPLHLLRAEEGMKGAVGLQTCLIMSATALCCVHPSPAGAA